MASYVRPMTAAERKHHGPYNLRDEGVVIAIEVASVGIVSNGVISYTDNLIIPPAYGRIAAYTTNMTDPDTPERTELSLVPCTEILTLEEIGRSPQKFQEGVFSSNTTLCVDPTDAAISQYADDLGAEQPLAVEFRFELCSSYSQNAS